MAKSRLNGFLWPLSLSCLVSLGRVYSGTSGERGLVRRKKVCNPHQRHPGMCHQRERKRKGGTHAWVRGDVKNP